MRVNTDCGRAGQQEEWVAVNPTDPPNVIVSQTGAVTGVHYSLQGGASGSFGDSSVFMDLVPCDPANPLCGPGGYWSYDLFTDPTHAFDPEGNLYFAAIGFDFLRDPLNGTYVWKGNACGKGQALGNPSDDRCFPIDGFAAVIHDNFAHPMDQDATPWLSSGWLPGDPGKSQVAAVWTTSQFGCGPGGSDLCSQPGFISRSTDGGVTWTRPMEVTGQAPFCVGGDAFTGRPTDAHACNLDEWIHHVIAPDGSIYVVWLNYNTPTLVNQLLFRRSTDSGATWSRVYRVAD
ncbi:MAG TPA: sialidase family protein, partial [Actinomycetota bacterium]|nr:sialidase family protein [Actinomycetota bacterium]